MKTFNSIEEIKELNIETGRFFFSEETMKFFGSRVLDDVFPHPTLPQTFFITSERLELFNDVFRPNKNTRFHCVRCAHPDGRISTMSGSEFQQSRQGAYSLAEKLITLDNPDFSSMYLDEIEKYVEGII